MMLVLFDSFTAPAIERNGFGSFIQRPHVRLVFVGNLIISHALVDACSECGCLRWMWVISVNVDACSGCGCCRRDSVNHSVCVCIATIDLQSMLLFATL